MTNRSFQIIPVLDLQRGIAVHAVAGRRAYYQPVQSILHGSSDPLELATALRTLLGLHSLYLADLDAIGGDAPNLALYQQLISSGFELIVDAGLRDLQSAERLHLLDRSSSTIVAGLETLESPRTLGAIVHAMGVDRTIFSLDLDDGHPRKADQSTWRSDGSFGLAREAIENGVRHILVLDLARVGTGRGSRTKGLIEQIRARNPEVNVSAGGGISSIAEVLDIKMAGACAVLVASALHDGRIGRSELLSMRAQETGDSLR
jgi:phosphoribosylformimino-5-aminoimidazole carboxamide ribotide isomerase